MSNRPAMPKKPEHIVAFVYEFILPGNRKFRGISAVGMKIFNRINSIINGLMTLHEHHTVEKEKIIQSLQNWLGIDKNATMRSQLQFSILHGYEVIEWITDKQLISKSLEVAKFNLNTYNEIPNFKDYIRSLVELEVKAKPQVVLASTFDNSEKEGKAGYDVYMKIKNTTSIIATSVITENDIDVAIDCTCYDTLEFKVLGERAYWQLVYFTIGIDISAMFSILSHRYYLAATKTIGVKISKPHVYGSVSARKERISKIISTMTDLAITGGYEIIAVSKTLSSEVIKRVKTIPALGSSYKNYCSRRLDVEAGATKKITGYCGYKY